MSETYGKERIQLITDIDDTVKSSGGVRLFWKVGPALGGIDTQYARGDFYPGVFQFAAEVVNFGKPPNMQPAPVAVLTARARELKLFLALKTGQKLCQQFRIAGERLFNETGAGSPDWGIDCDRTVLYGSVAEWILQWRKGWRKFDNFQKLRTLNDERTRYVLVGDTGEYDAECGESMAYGFREEVRACFFHVVSERDWLTKGRVELPADKRVNGVPFFYFRTYVGAARKAFRAGLIGVDELIRVIRQAQADLAPVPRDDAKWADLRADTELAIVALGAALDAPAAAAAGIPQASPPGSRRRQWLESVLGRFRM